MDADYRNDDNSVYEDYWYEEKDLLLIARKMLSYKTLMLASLVIGIVASVIWGTVFCKTSVNLSVSYVQKVFFDTTTSNSDSSTSTLSDVYGIKYITPDELISSIIHTSTAEAFLNEKGIDEGEIPPKVFLSPMTVKYNKGIISITLEKIGEDMVELYKEYISYCMEAYNEEFSTNTASLLKEARETIKEELNAVEKAKYTDENSNMSKHSYSITLKDRIKVIDNQLSDIKEGAIRVYSDYEEEKSSGRMKGTAIIILVALVIGAGIVFLLSFTDLHIYFSDDMTNIPSLGKKILSSIPLYGKDGISDKEYLSILSKLPDDISSISVSEISPFSGAEEISKGLERISSKVNVKYSGSLIKDGDILKEAKDFDVNLVVLRAGIDTINQVRNIVRDYTIKGLDNYYFILYGLEPTDKAVTLFEDKSRYIKYPFYSFRTLREHYMKYYKG